MRVRFSRHYLPFPIALLAVAEALFVLCAPLLVDWLLQGRPVSSGVPDLQGQGPKVLAFALSCGLALTAMGLYSARQRARTTGVILRAGVGFLIGTILVMVASYFDELLRPNPTQLLLWTATAFALTAGARAAANRFVDENLFKRRVLVYGAGQRALSLSRLRRRADQRGFLIVGYVAAPGERVLVDAARLLAGTADQMLDLARSCKVDEIVVAMDDRRLGFPVRELLNCRLGGIEVIDLVSFLERESGRVQVDVLNPSWMIFGEGFRRNPFRQVTKRIFDTMAALVLLAITWPLMVLAALAIVVEDGLRAPVFYRQSRVGLDGQIFQVLKFRSMRVDAERDGRPRWASSSDARVTRVGRLIRKVRIDELPQILNVLRGDMSFVGPRPERPEFVARLGETIPYYDERHCTKPGITGWAQLCYPYGASEQDAVEKLQYDLYYVKNHTLLIDILILLQTVEVVLFGKGGR